jgi:type 1 glutamine amidotransferase
MAMTIGRREFIGLLGGATLHPLVARPLVAHAQQRLLRVLYCTHSAGYRHDVIPLSRTILQQVGAHSGAFAVTATEDVADFSSENLRRYDTVMFFTTGELPMNDAQRAAFLDFVRSGHGFVGVHSATDTFYEWPDYGELIGGYFDGHPWHQAVRIKVADASDALVSSLPSSFEVTDEIYQIRNFDERASHVLLRLDDTSADLTKDGVHRHPYGWPLAWTRPYGMGRVFYTALGHEAGVWRDPRYQQLLRNAILWSARRLP